jgi:hypothetical protein
LQFKVTRKEQEDMQVTVMVAELEPKGVILQVMDILIEDILIEVPQEVEVMPHQDSIILTTILMVRTM